MRLRQEQTLLLLTVGLLGLFLWNSRGADTMRVRRSSGSDTVLERHPVPEVSRAQPEARDTSPTGRDLFAPPRDTRPLPKLEFEAPPIPAASALRPPGVPGVGPRWYGRLLRADATPHLVADSPHHQQRAEPGATF